MKQTLQSLLATVLTTTLTALASGASAHIVLDEPAAPAGTSYKAVFRVSHGCDGSPTTGIKVFMPAGFSGAKPMPKPGWVVAVRSGKLAVPYMSHGKQVTEDVTEISWTAAGKESWLQEAWYDEFVLRGGLPEKAGALWFRVLQSCEQGQVDWAQIPATGTSTKGLKNPAALVETTETGHAGGHQH